jgi:DNA-binding NarL/FixJ family response regulator
MCEGANPVPSLHGTRVIAVVCDTTQALAIATMLARAGASVRVARSVEAARDLVAEAPEPFDVAMLDRELGDDGLAELVALLGGGPSGCAHVVLAAADELETAGSLGEALVTAAVHGVEATQLARRAAIEGPPHTPPPLLRPVPRVEQAIDELADCRRLSPRERVVLRYIALGYKYGEISREMAISLSTVKMHMTNVRRKVGAGTRGELLRKMFAA